MAEITQLLTDARAGKPGTQEALFSCIYGELNKLARAKLSGTGPLTLLDSSSLVHEVFLRLTRKEKLPPGNSSMFYGYAASVMRSVIVDYVRQRQSAKRGDGMRPITLVTRGMTQHDMRDPDAEALEDALCDLQNIDERCSKVVEMRYFAGMSSEEIAVALEVSTATVERDWQKARAFLFKALRN